MNLNEAFTIKVNPRWQNANFQITVVTTAGTPVPVPYPVRYETPQDALLDKNRIPPLLKLYRDGRQEESF
jgi:hypothetical protein